MLDTEHRNRAKTGLTVGYSHPVEIPEEDGVEFDVPAPNKIIVKELTSRR